MIFPSRLLIPLVMLTMSIVFLSACGDDIERGDAPDTADPEESWEVRGYYLGSNPDEGTITLVHEEIPDVMDAMRMRMLLPEPNEVEGLNRGDAVSFRLFRRGNSWYVDSISVLSPEEGPELEEQLMDML